MLINESPAQKTVTNTVTKEVPVSLSKGDVVLSNIVKTRAPGGGDTITYTGTFPEAVKYVYVFFVPSEHSNNDYINTKFGRGESKTVNEDWLGEEDVVISLDSSGKNLSVKIAARDAHADDAYLFIGTTK